MKRYNVVTETRTDEGMEQVVLYTCNSLRKAKIVAREMGYYPYTQPSGAYQPRAMVWDNEAQTTV